jgi:hypothetical protein
MASIIGSARIGIILLFIEMGQSNKKVGHPLMLRRVSGSFVQSESDYLVILNYIFGLPSHLIVGFKNSLLFDVLEQYFITLYVVFTFDYSALPANLFLQITTIL